MNLVGIHSDGTLMAPAGPRSEIAASVIASTVGLYAKVGWNPPWIGYLAFEGGEYVGTCAFTGAPKEGVVELAYFTFPGHERRGVATRMAEQLTAFAKAADPAVRVTAHTLPGESASTRILRRVGFEFVGPRDHPVDGPIWVWEDRRPPPTAG